MERVCGIDRERGEVRVSVNRYTDCVSVGEEGLQAVCKCVRERAREREREREF